MKIGFTLKPKNGDITSLEKQIIKLEAIGVIILSSKSPEEFAEELI